MSDDIEAGDRANTSDPSAAEALLPLVYRELRDLAASKLAQERPGQTLSATALVHEAYMRITQGERPSEWNDRQHFFAAAATAMRRILVDAARQKRRERRGGRLQRLEFAPDKFAVDMPPDQFLALDEAMTRLAKRDPQAARLVELHCFAGLPIAEAAAALGISERTGYRDWAFAQAWLFREVSGEPPSEDLNEASPENS